MVAFVSTLGVFPNVTSEQLLAENMNLERAWELCLTNDSILCTDSLREIIIMIIVKQGMWIIRFEHDKESFQSNQNLLYESILRSFPLDQAQDVTKVEIPIYKDI